MLNQKKDLAAKKVGLALGGGGARGFAHMGVLKVFEEAGIPVDLIVGTSMGALVGAVYAQTGSAQAAINHLQVVMKEQNRNARFLNLYATDKRGDHFLDYVTQRIQQRIIINLSITRKSLLSSSRLELAVADLIQEGDVEDLNFQLGIMASDLISGKGVVLRHGSIRKAVVASSSIPGFFPPVEWGDLLLVDGEVTDLVPVEACYALGADFVVAVDVTPDIRPMRELHHTIDIFLRSARITNHRQAEVSLQKADFVLRPVQNDVQWSEFERLDELIGVGEQHAKLHLRDILQTLQRTEPRMPPADHRSFKQTHIDSADFAASNL